MVGKECAQRRIDPDPFTVAALALAACSLITSLGQLYVAESTAGRTPQPQRLSASAGGPRRTRLLQIDHAAEVALRGLRDINRTIELGSPNPGRQFYEAPLRLGETQLDLNSPEFQHYSRLVAQTLTAIGGLSIWVHQVIASDSGLAFSLGKRLSAPSTAAIDAINSALAEGAPIGSLLAQTMMLFEALRAAVADELGSN